MLAWIRRCLGQVTQPADPPARAPRKALSITAHVVFVGREADVMTLDCVISPGQTPPEMPPGMPFTVVAELPKSEPWAADATAAILETWARRGTAVDVDIVINSHGAAVRMSHASTHLNLGIAA